MAFTRSFGFSGSSSGGGAASLRQRLATRLAALPSLCAVCHGWGTQRICAACIHRFAAPCERCLQCGLAVPPGLVRCGACVTAPPPFARTITAVDYGHPWDHLISRFKFHAALDLAPALAQRMLDAWDPSNHGTPGLLLPMPLSDARLRERGHNQAWVLTRLLARATGCRCDPHLLLRVKDTPHQIALPPAERAGNVRHAFAVEPRRRDAVRGQRVTLVDDVMTTGATAAEAARTLLQAGAAEVVVWVVARTPRPGHGVA